MAARGPTSKGWAGKDARRKGRGKGGKAEGRGRGRKELVRLGLGLSPPKVKFLVTSLPRTTYTPTIRERYTRTDNLYLLANIALHRAVTKTIYIRYIDTHCRVSNISPVRHFPAAR